MIVHCLTDDEVSDRERRRSLFSGNVFVYAPRSSTATVCRASLDLIERILGTDPIAAQQLMSETQFAMRFETATRGFDQIATDLVRAVIADFSCDPTVTFVRSPSLIADTGGGFIPHGLGVHKHPHRDTWYAASPSLVNWWIPLSDLDASSSLAFHPGYWDLPVLNSSSDFDYERWSDSDRVSRGGTVTDRVLGHPRPLDQLDQTPEIRIGCAAGGLILSSVAHLYSTVPNESQYTHFTVHFQTVTQTDLESGACASNLDADARGTSLEGFVRCSDLSPIPEELIERDLERRRLATRSNRFG